ARRKFSTPSLLLSRSLPMSDKNFEANGDPAAQEQETQFHYPAGKFDEELVEATHGGWASEAFNEDEFDYNFDESEFGEVHFIDDEILDSASAVSRAKSSPKRSGQKLSAPSACPVLRTLKKSCARWLLWAVRMWASPPWSTVS